MFSSSFKLIKPLAPSIRKGAGRVHFGLATIPSRIRTLEATIESIYDQADTIFVYLNGYAKTPFFLYAPKIVFWRSDDFGDLNDRGKYFGLNQVKAGLYFTVDDDIVYPPDYVERMIAALRASDFRAAVGVHGVIYPPAPRSFFDRHVIHYRRDWTMDFPVSLLGTGTAAFDVRQVPFALAEARTGGMADIWFARFLKARRLPAVCVARDADWLRDAESAAASLYADTKRQPRSHTAEILSAGPWGYGDIKERIEAAGQAARFSPVVASLVEAAATLERAERSSRFLFRKRAEGHDRPFLSAAPLIPLVCDRPTAERLYAHVLEHKSERRAVSDVALAKLMELDPDRVSAELRDRFAVEASEEAFVQVLRALRAAFRHRDALALIARRRAELRRLGAAIGFQKIAILYELGDFAALHSGHVVAAKKVSSVYLKLMYFIASVQCGDAPGAGRWLVNLMRARPKEVGQVIGPLIRGLRQCPVANRAQVPFWLLDDLELFAPEALVLAAFAARECASEETVLRCAYELRMRGASLREPALFEAFTAAREVEMAAGLNRMLPAEARLPIAFSFESDYGFFQALAAVGPGGAGAVEEPLVSVVMTCFNAAATIDYAIRSIRAQTYGRWELIVIDDGSTDGTTGIVESFGDPRIRLLRNAANVGPYVSRNRALEVAQGTFIAIQDADDCAHPMRLARQVAALAEGNRVASTTGHVRLDRRSRLRVENEGRILGHGPMTLVCKREIFDRLGAFKPVRTRGDVEFHHRIKAIYGDAAFHKTNDLLLFALHSETSNSHRMSCDYERQKELHAFRKAFQFEHAAMRAQAVAEAIG